MDEPQVSRTDDAAGDSRSMRITYIHQYFTTPEMAGGTRSHDFARRLVEAGHEVNMITSATDGRRQGGWFVTDEASITVHWLPVRYSNAMSYRARMVAFMKFVIGASIRAASLKADVVFATSTPLTVAVPAVVAARWQRVPMVFEVRDLWPTVPIAMGALNNPLLRSTAKWLERWAYRNAESVVALSPGMRDGIVATGYPRERVAMIPNGSDLEGFKPDARKAAAFRAARPWLGDRPLLLYAGALGRANGVSWLVQLTRELVPLVPDLRVLVIGDGFERSSVEAAASDGGLLNTVFFMEPPVAKGDVAAAFCAADMTACLFIGRESLWTGSPNKLFDSLAAGTPVLINYGGWQASLLETRNAGLVVPSADPACSAQHVARILNSRDELVAMGERARALAEELFDRERHAHQLLSVLHTARHNRGEFAADVSEGNSR